MNNEQHAANSNSSQDEAYDIAMAPYIQQYIDDVNAEYEAEQAQD